MNKNYLQVELGGHKRGLSFNLGTLRHIGEATGKDPFSFVVDSDKYDVFMKDLGAILYAGLLSNANKTRSKIDFTLEDAHRWADEIENMNDAITIVRTFQSAYKVESAPREGGEDTQPEAADVA